MSFCSFADGAAMFGATPIENLFLMNYMKDAPGPALKVYLYARMLALHPELGGTLEDVAKILALQEDEVYDCFTYWEHRGLLRRVADNPPSYAFMPMQGTSPAADTLLEKEMYANREFNNRLRRLFGDNIFIGDHELRKAEEWQSILKFEQDAILRMVEYGIEQAPRRNPKPPSVFKRVDKLAEAWSQRGLRTLADVNRAIAEESGEAAVAREVLKRLGISRQQPSEPELELVRRWTQDWGYDQAAILEACQDTTNAQKPTFGYLNSILENRRDALSQLYRPVTELLRALNPRSTQPTRDQLKRYRALLDAGFSPELIQLAAVQCHRRNLFSFDDLEWRLNVWREDGVATPEQAEAYTNRMAALSRELREVFRRAGRDDKRPGHAALKTYESWREAFPQALIFFAAECAQNAREPVPYMDKLLAQWRESGVTTVEQARAQHKLGAPAPDAGPASPANPALDYAQRAYRDEDFGDDFYFNYDRFYGPEEDKP